MTEVLMLLAPISQPRWFSPFLPRRKKPEHVDFTGRPAQLYQVMRHKRHDRPGFLQRCWEKFIGRPNF